MITRPTRMLILLALLLVVPVSVTALTHYWSQSFDAQSNNAPGTSAVTTDNEGNAILVANGGAIDFGGGPLPPPILFDNLLIAKFGPNGDHLWSRSFGGYDFQWSGSVAADPSGNVIVAGNFLGPLTFGGDDTLSATTIGEELYFAKLDRHGNYVWSRQFPMSPFVTDQMLAVDPSGDIILAASDGHAVDFGGGTLTPSGHDWFIAKFDTDGNHLWSQNFGGASTDRLESVATDASGNIVVAGTFSNSIDFGGGALTGGLHELCAAKLDPSGTHIWSQSYGDPGDFNEVSVAIDAGGAVTLSGDFAVSVDFGGGSLTGAGDRDVFLARLDANGVFEWQKRYGDGGSQIAREVAVGAGGGAFITGENFFGSVDFGGGALSDDGLFIAAISNSGSHVSSAIYNGASGNSIATDSWGNVIAYGGIGSPTDFGGGTLPVSGNVDIYLVKFGATSTAVPVDLPRNALGVVTHPNPFNPSTSITYTVPSAGHVTVQIFDPQGRWVATLVDEPDHAAGRHTIEYDAKTASGVYFVRVETSGATTTKKIVLVK